jgi:hypothetical protein
MDDQITRAIQIGEENAVILQLCQNFCANLQVERFGGTGMVEVATGLPIGSRSFKCQHASAGGMAGMDLRMIALDFYDRNCKGCQKRIPIRMPNLTDVVAERDEEILERHRKAQQQQDARQEAYRKRSEARQRAKLDCDEPTAGLIDAIDRLDEGNTPEAGEVLVELARVASQAFDPRVTDLLYSLAESTDSITVNESVFGTLRIVSNDTRRLCSLALKFLAKYPNSVAADIVAQFVDDSQASLIPAALPHLIYLAGPDEHRFLGPPLPEEPAGLKAVYRVTPKLVLTAFEKGLAGSQKIARIRVVHAISTLRESDPGCGISLIPLLVASTELPDDGYSVGSAETWVQDLIAEMLEANFEAADAPLSEAFRRLDSQRSDAGLDQVYLRMFRGFRHRQREERRMSPAHETIFARLVSILSTKSAEQGSTDLLEFLRHDAIHYIDLVERHLDGLLGALAILNEERTSEVASFLQLELPPNPLAAMEASQRKQHLYWLVSAVAKLLGEAAERRPETIGKALVDTLEKVSDGHNDLRASLVEAIGIMGRNRVALPQVLPLLYGALTGQSTLVRASAIRAYGDVLGRTPEDLPPLLHETFLTSLTDPFVIVHTAAVHLLDRHRLPHAYDKQLEFHVLLLIEAHSRGSDDRNLLKTALDVYLDFQRGKPEKMPDALCDWIIERIGRCKLYEADDIMKWHCASLWHRPKFLQLLLGYLKNPQLNEHQTANLLEVLEKVPANMLRTSAAEVLSAFKSLVDSEYYAIDAGIEILTCGGLWDEAMALAEHEETRLGNSEWERARKLASQERVLGCSIEAFAQRGDVDAMKSAIAKLRTVQNQREEDEKKNAKKRDPLFDIVGQD